MPVNIVLITLDCVRPGCSGCYEYKYNSNNKNWFFGIARNHCRKGIYTYIGNLTFKYCVRFNACPVEINFPAIAQILQEKIIKRPLLLEVMCWITNLVLIIIRNWGDKVKIFSRNANKATNSAKKWLKCINENRSLFLWLHYILMHTIVLNIHNPWITFDFGE